jgi:DNA-directed RNA polymerase II subunit RPB1
VTVPGEDSFSKAANESATIMFHIMLRSTFATKRVLKEYRLNRAALDFITGQVADLFARAQVRHDTETRRGVGGEG